MDHFKLPPGAQHYIFVPYKCTEPYDGGDFHTYPERKGWTIDDIEGKNEYGYRRPEEIEMFFQSWLFFGVIVEVFKIVDIKINIDDFIDYDKGLVTTHKLPELMEELTVAWKKTWPDDLTYEFAFTPKAVATTEIFNTVVRVMRPYCYGHAVGVPVSARTSPLSPEMVVSIIGLVTTFRHASSHMFVEFGHRSIKPGPGGTPLLRSILRKKWCPFQVNAMQVDLKLDGQYYVGALQGLSKNELQRHSDCTDIRCVEKPVDEDTYVLKHAITDCSCQPVPVPEQDLLEAIERGDTPVLFYLKGDDGEHRLEVRGYNTAMGTDLPYIAISHVWSDGMGNPKQNALPGCLLERIQKMVDNVDFRGQGSGPYNGHVGFWMDTLCIPVDPKHDDQRKSTIIKMRQIYQESFAVLVLESELQTVSSTAPIIERCIPLYLTKWIRRLWTYQEGGLPGWLNIQFCDNSLALHKVYAEVGVDPFVPERRLENMTLHMERQLAGQFISDVQGQFGLLQGALLNWMNENRMDEMRWAAFLPMISSFSSRMTTRQSDESLCLASVLVLDTTPLVRVKGSDELKSKDKEIRRRADRELADRRMAVLYRLIGRFMDSIIFTKYPRLPLEGFRWGPRTYLGELLWFYDPELEPSYKEYGMNLGTIHTWGADPHENVGLLVRFPLITLNGPFNLDGTEDQRIVVDTRIPEPIDGDTEVTTDKIIGGRHIVEPVLSHDDSEGFSWINDVTYLLVMQTPLDKRVAGQTKLAVLGQLLLSAEHVAPPPRIKHERLVRVTLLFPTYEFGDDTSQMEGLELPERPLIIV
ncbi:hypothetical protein Clacol_005545 [Clathrus columnatus]|uniref:Heterokaryon incompatibility domain-containing protein n=1 Tax=Clathrus columnatus TaxID=1419009 RepID=A0AAV5ACV8_9AGAM|nr:hypothetical protein Clacol_005545 [Clathrus columnatus]